MGVSVTYEKENCGCEYKHTEEDGGASGMGGYDNYELYSQCDKHRKLKSMEESLRYSAEQKIRAKLAKASREM